VRFTVILFDAPILASKIRCMSANKSSLFKTLKPEDHVALYALTSKLLILHEFTDDTSALVKAVNEYKTKDLAIFDQSNPDSMNFANMTGQPAGLVAVGPIRQRGNERSGARRSHLDYHRCVICHC